MNQENLSRGVVELLRREAGRDQLGWVPAVGQQKAGGAPRGLAFELIGSVPTRAQLRVLARVLFRLGTSGLIEIAAFRRSGEAPTRLAQPLRHSDQTIYELAGAGSKPLRLDGSVEYGVRLATPR